MSMSETMERKLRAALSPERLEVVDESHLHAGHGHGDGGAFDGSGGADEADRWEMDDRIRDVAVGPDGAIWLIEDNSPGRLLRLTPSD